MFIKYFWYIKLLYYLYWNLQSLIVCTEILTVVVLRNINIDCFKKAILVQKNTLYKCNQERGFHGNMKEQELNTMMSVVSDPIENVYKIESYRDLAEIQRAIRIFDIVHEQQKESRHVMLSIENLSTLRLVLSNN